MEIRAAVALGAGGPPGISRVRRGRQPPGSIAQTAVPARATEEPGPPEPRAAPQPGPCRHVTYWFILIGRSHSCSQTFNVMWELVICDSG